MSNPEERDLRVELSQAQQQRNSIRFREILMVVGAVGLFLAAVLAGADLALANKQFLTYMAAGLLIVAGFYNLYNSVIVQPLLNRLQTELNADINDRVQG